MILALKQWKTSLGEDESIYILLFTCRSFTMETTTPALVILLLLDSVFYLVKIEIDFADENIWRMEE